MKKTVKKISENYRLLLGMLVVGLFLGWLIFHPSKAESVSEMKIEGHDAADHSLETPSIWTCSMHPQIKQDKPGQCPICAMDLIPLITAQSTGDDLDPYEIVLTESAAKLADIQTMVVSKGTPQKSLYLQGKVQPDERNIAELTARFGGRIEKLFVNFTGQHVQKGEKLATIYSPDLVTAQRELLEAMAFKENRPSFYMAARAKLKLWDITEDQIIEIEEKGEPQLYFDIRSPISGTVMRRHVALGDYVKEGTALFQVTDLSRVWVLFDAYESDLPWIKTGDLVELTIPSLPGKSYMANVTHIDPYINSTTRVANVRIELPNQGSMMKPEMFAKGLLHSKIAESSDHLLIPKSSILWTGKRAVVYVSQPERDSPSFLYREITLGPEAGNFYVVSEGLQEGEVIAVNGVFKIDAAAQLEGKPSMMNPGGGKVSSGHDHGSMTVAEYEDHSQHETMEMEAETIEISEEFKKQLQGVYDSYSFMVNAFVSSDAEEVRISAEKVESSLQKVDMGLLAGEAHRTWMKYLEILESEISAISTSKNISTQRLSFAEFSDALYASVKAFGLHHGRIYYQYCPMANGDKGAYWISNMEEIENPYFGDEMLKCGETRETIEF
jgi:Cu(I)/Ag(I) efflux system membrane fusion protein